MMFWWFVQDANCWGIVAYWFSLIFSIQNLSRAFLCNYGVDTSIIHTLDKWILYPHIKKILNQPHLLMHVYFCTLLEMALGLYVTLTSIVSNSLKFYCWACNNWWGYDTCLQYFALAMNLVSAYGFWGFSSNCTPFYHNVWK